MVDLKEVVYPKLLLSKQFYKHGVVHSGRNTSVDRCLSIHHFHISVDIVLNSVIDLHHVKTGNKPRLLRFHEKISKINSHFADRGIAVPYENKLLGLNDQRNNVQHDATAPDIGTVKEYMTFTELFLKEAFKLFFWQDFDNISEISLIEDARLRSLVEMARNYIENGNYKDASIYISIAYLLSAISIGKDTDFSPKKVYEGRLDTDSRGLSIDGPHGPIYREVSRDYEKVLFISELGIIKADYEKFVSIIPASFLTIDERVRTWGRSGPQPTRDESLWALEFLVQIILKWQNQGLKPRIEQDTIT